MPKYHASIETDPLFDTANTIPDPGFIKRNVTSLKNWWGSVPPNGNDELAGYGILGKSNAVMSDKLSAVRLQQSKIQSIVNDVAKDTLTPRQFQMVRTHIQPQYQGLKFNAEEAEELRRTGFWLMSGDNTYEELQKYSADRHDIRYFYNWALTFDATAEKLENIARRARNETDTELLIELRREVPSPTLYPWGSDPKYGLVAKPTDSPDIRLLKGHMAERLLLHIPITRDIYGVTQGMAKEWIGSNGDNWLRIDRYQNYELPPSDDPTKPNQWDQEMWPTDDTPSFNLKQLRRNGRFPQKFPGYGTFKTFNTAMEKIFPGDAMAKDAWKNNAGFTTTTDSTAYDGFQIGPQLTVLPDSQPLSVRKLDTQYNGMVGKIRKAMSRYGGLYLFGKLIAISRVLESSSLNQADEDMYSQPRDFTKVVFSRPLMDIMTRCPPGMVPQFRDQYGGTLLDREVWEDGPNGKILSSAVDLSQTTCRPIVSKPDTKDGSFPNLNEYKRETLDSFGGSAPLPITGLVGLTTGGAAKAGAMTKRRRRRRSTKWHAASARSKYLPSANPLGGRNLMFNANAMRLGRYDSRAVYPASHGKRRRVHRSTSRPRRTKRARR